MHRTALSDAFIAGSRGVFNWPIWVYLAIVGYAVIMIVTLANQAIIAEYLGTLFLAFSFFAFLTLILTALIWKSKRRKFSYIGFLAFVAVVIAWTDWSDNHRLELAGISDQAKSIKK